jgi:alpha-beta hydrolase superfamily lysophospholipase
MRPADSIKGEFRGKSGIKIEYVMHRSANPKGNIVAVPGGDHNVDVWRKQLPLAERYNMFIYKGDGFDSENAGHLLSLCRQFSMTLPHLVGHSMGTFTCFEYCKLTKQEPGYRPSTVTLVAPMSTAKEKIGHVHALTRLRLILSSTGEGTTDKQLLSFMTNRAGLPSGARVELCCGHYPFQDNFMEFNHALLKFVDPMH